MNDRRATSRTRGAATPCASGRSSSTASSRRARCRARAAAARGAARRSPTASAAGTRRSGRATSSSRSSPASCSSAAGFRSRSVGIYVPRGLVSTLVMCAVPGAGRRRRADRRRDAARRAPGSSPRRRRRSASTRCGRSAGRRRSPGSRTSSGVDQIVGPGNAYVNEAKLAVSRDVAIDLPAGPSEVVVLASNGTDPRIVELELAAQAEHGAGLACAASSTTLEEAEALAPEHLVLLGDEAEALAPSVRNAGAVFVGAVVAGRRRRLRDRRQPRPADRRLGAQRRRARARDVPQAGDDPAAHAPTGSRACGRSSRRSPRPRACPRTRRRCADEGALAGVHRLRLGAVDGGDRASSRASIRSRSSASTATSPPQPLPSSRPGTIAGRARAHQHVRARRLPGARSTRSRATRASRRRTSCSARARTT